MSHKIQCRGEGGGKEIPGAGCAIQRWHLLCPSRVSQGYKDTCKVRGRWAESGLAVTWVFGFLFSMPYRIK